MANTVEFRGIKEFDAMMGSLHPKLRTRIVKSVFRTASAPLRNQMRANAKAISVRLGKSIGNITPKTAPNAASRQALRGEQILGVGPRTGKHLKEKDGWFAGFIEYGVEGIGRFTSKKSGTSSDYESNPFRRAFARLKGTRRYRADQPPRPFVRPAVDAKMPEVKRGIAKAHGDVIKKEVAKYERRTGSYKKFI